MPVSLQGNLSDITTSPIEKTTSVTVKAPVVRPDGYQITTSQPQRVIVSSGGEFSITVVPGVGWLYIEGDGWSDTVRFVAAEGMTTMWQAIVNAYPAGSSMRAYLSSLEDARAEVRRAMDQALKTVDASVQKAIQSKLWYKGPLTIDMDLNSVTEAGYYSIESNTVATSLKNIPDDSSANTMAVLTVKTSGKTVEQVWSVTHISGRFDQPVYRRAKSNGGTWQPWRRMDNGAYWFTGGQNLDDTTTPGLHLADGPSVVRSLLNAPPAPASSAVNVEVVLVGGGRLLQRWVSFGVPGVNEHWERLRSSTGDWLPWQKKTADPRELEVDETDLNALTTFGVYTLPDARRVRSMSNTPPGPAASSALIEVLPIGATRVMQRYTETRPEGVGRSFVRLLSSTGDWLPWQQQGTYNTADTSTPVFTHGDSQVGAAYAWANLMGDAPFSVTNHGTSGATPDQVLLQDGVIGVPVPVMTLGAGESRTLAWKRAPLVRQDRNTAYVISVGGSLATLTYYVDTDTWMISSKTGLVVREPTTAYALRAADYDGARHIVWFGGNAIRTGLHQTDETQAEHVETAYARAIEVFGRNTIICGYVPAYGDKDGTAVANEVNAWLGRVVPTQFLNVRQKLQNAASVILGRRLTSQDEADIAAGWLPREMYRDDRVHLTDATHQWLSGLFAQYPAGATPRLAVGNSAA